MIIALELGYTSPSHFAQPFRNLARLTPTGSLRHITGD